MTSSLHSTLTCSPSCPLRRAFLSDCVKAAAAAAMVPSVGAWLAGCGGDNTPQSFETGTPADPNTQASGSTSFSFSTYPALASVGGAIMTQVGSTPVAVVRVSASQAVVLDATCPHQGCTVGAYNSQSQTFTCPCHGSVFGESGAVQQGPATHGLTAYPAMVGATEITATVS